ncbi:hypothetical protein [Nonomuraea dietziae]|uniref:hypothetical protein n=2 Tax=Nonomuraea dietziae TaxID=65515 RepID=UPI00160CE62B
MTRFLPAPLMVTSSPWRRAAGSVPALGALQRRLLASALDAVRPGGVVAYVTCSPHLAETGVVVADVLKGRDDIETLDARAYLPEIGGLGVGSYVQLLPHRHNTHAIFLEFLQKGSSAGGPCPHRRLPLASVSVGRIT